MIVKLHWWQERETRGNLARMQHGELRVIARGPTYPDLLGQAFDQIAAGKAKADKLN